MHCPQLELDRPPDPELERIRVFERARHVDTRINRSYRPEPAFGPGGAARAEHRPGEVERSPTAERAQQPSRAQSRRQSGCGRASARWNAEPAVTEPDQQLIDRRRATRAADGAQPAASGWEPDPRCEPGVAARR